MTRHRNHLFLSGACTIALGLICGTAAFGQQSDRDQQRSGDSQQQAGNQSANQTELPQYLQKLDLEEDQKSQIRQALRQHNQKFMQTRKKFQEKHARTVELEAAWASAVRDSLSEEDQRKFDQQRMQDRELSRHSDANASQRQSAEDRQSDAAANNQRNTGKSADDSAESRDTARQQREDRRNERQQARSDANESRDRQGEEDQGIGFVVITAYSPERFLQGANQDSQQKQQCSEACRQYKQELTSAWQNLHRLHHELVQIEADRTSAVEEQLTEEQLTKLRKEREQPPAETASTTSGSNRSR